MEEEETKPPLLGLIVLFVGAAFITVGVAFLTFGLYSLVRTGAWPHYPFSQMLSEIGVPVAQGGQGPIAWIISQSACVVLLIIGAIITSLGAWRIARHNRRQRLAAEAAEAAEAAAA
jgi:hypothetical protein